MKKDYIVKMIQMKRDDAILESMSAKTEYEREYWVGYSDALGELLEELKED